MANSTTTAERFAARFAGLERAHGEYEVPEGARANDKGKVEGPRGTHPTPLTPELFERHLTSRTFGLGVVPIRDDDTCVFGAIDVDVYPLDLVKIDAEVRRLRLPLITCRTKSGGCHLYLFTAEPAQAALIRERLLEWSVVLGYPGSEVFPKQTRLASEQDYGNWINIPYQGGDKTMRYAVGVDGRALKLAAFLDLADQRAVTVSELEGFILPEDEVSGDLFEESPPCLEALARRGFPEGSRNNALFNVAVYLKRRYGESWADRLPAYNERFMQPPLDPKEMADTARSVGKKDHSYKCKDQPICDVCNRQVCIGREHGVGRDATDPGVVLGPLVKVMTDPPVWIWDVNGARIEITEEELMNQRAFNKVAVRYLNVWPNMMKAPAWQRIVKERLTTVEVVEVPEDATTEGQWMAHLQAFCTSRASGRNIDELLMGRPFTDDGDGRVYFRSTDFLAYMQQQRVPGVTTRSVYAWLRREGLDHHFRTLKGKGTNFWSVPAFSRQTADFDVPVKPAEEM